MYLAVPWSSGGLDCPVFYASLPLAAGRPGVICVAERIPRQQAKAHRQLRKGDSTADTCENVSLLCGGCHTATCLEEGNMACREVCAFHHQREHTRVGDVDSVRPEAKFCTCGVETRAGTQAKHRSCRSSRVGTLSPNRVDEDERHD